MKKLLFSIFFLVFLLAADALAAKKRRQGTFYFENRWNVYELVGTRSYFFICTTTSAAAAFKVWI